MTQQTEAHRLADALDALLGYRGINVDVGKAAAELRRLDEAYDWQYKMAGDRLRRIEKLERINAQLLEALEDLERTAGQPAMADDPVRVKARAAIVAAEG